MKTRNLLCSIALILIITLIATFGISSCRSTAEQSTAQASQQHTEEASQSQDIDTSDIRVRAYQFAQDTVMDSYPDADIVSGYSSDNVIEEAPGVFQVEVEGSDGSVWYCVLQQTGNSFEVIELVQAGTGAPGGEEEHVAEEGQEQPKDSPPEGQQEQAPPEEQPQDESPPEEQTPQQEPESQQPPTEQEIMERAFYAAQADVEQKGESDESNGMVAVGCPVVFDQPFYNEYIKKVGTNLYQCSIDFSTPTCVDTQSGTLRRWLYLVRYNSIENKMYIPFKTNWYELRDRAFWQAQNYIVTSEETNINCDDIIFKIKKPDNQSGGIVELEEENNWDTFIAVIEYECHKESNVGNRLQRVRLRYDIMTDSFTDFSYISGGSI
jgi:hypothetical protein